MDIQKAVSLAKWLIEQKGVIKKTAYIIASRKFKIENWHDIQKGYNELKPEQLKII